MHRICALIICFGLCNFANAVTKVVELQVGYKSLNFVCQDSCGIAVNQQIPAPTLHFTQGDEVTINVHNNLCEPTAIHWHGILVPWQMDGVEGITQEGIPPGKSFSYKFKLEQSGTYWYHAHAGLQEQQGLYGALVIDPPQAPQYKYTKDLVIVLSDWINTPADTVFANLKKDGEYYAPEFPLQASLQRFMQDYCNADCAERKKILDDYKMMQQMRMGIYDFSDVAYDAFLLNGHSNCNPWQEVVKVGDEVRLRFIGASAATIFRVKIPGANMQMVHVDGNDIQPYAVEDFNIAPGETFDVLVKIQQDKPYIIYAESLNKQGAAFGALITSAKQKPNYKCIKPFPTPEPTTRAMMHMNMGTMRDTNQDMQMSHMQMSGMHMSGMQPTHKMSMSATSQYSQMIAAVKTNDPNIPVYKQIKMDLFGFMDQYIWFINGKPEYAVEPIIFEPGKRYRITFNNSSMMHHPMHIHGHWFILRQGNGEYDPLLHTINVAPGETIVVDIDADASGQWFFHCHMLYHMKAGMARVFQYSTLPKVAEHRMAPENQITQTAYHNRPLVRVDEVRPINQHLVAHPMAHGKGFYFSNQLEIGFDPFINEQLLTFKGLYGPDYHKLELFINDAEMDSGKVTYADIDMFYWYLIDQFWAIKGGANYFYRPALKPYWQPGIGIEGLAPYFIALDLRAYYFDSCAKFDLEFSRDVQLTNNLFVQLGIRTILATKTIARAQLGGGLNEMRYIVHPYYRLGPGLNFFVEYEYQRNYGTFRNMQNTLGQATVNNTFTFGLGFVF